MNFSFISKVKKVRHKDAKSTHHVQAGQRVMMGKVLLPGMYDIPVDIYGAHKG